MESITDTVPLKLTPAQLAALRVCFPTLLDEAMIERGGWVLNDDKIAVWNDDVVTLTWKGRGEHECHRKCYRKSY